MDNLELKVQEVLATYNKGLIKSVALRAYKGNIITSMDEFLK